MDPHVERARQIADALDSPDREQTLHEQFHAEWKAWEAEDPTRTMAAFDREIGRGNDYTGRIVRFCTGSAAARTPFSDEQSGRAMRGARTVLRDPEQRKAVIESLTPEEKTDLAAEVMDDDETAEAVLDEHIERLREKRQGSRTPQSHKDHRKHTEAEAVMGNALAKITTGIGRIQDLADGGFGPLTDEDNLQLLRACEAYQSRFVELADTFRDLVQIATIKPSDFE